MVAATGLAFAGRWNAEQRSFTTSAACVSHEFDARAVRELSMTSGSPTYIGASPRCEKNHLYAAKQAKAFLEGRSAPDFAAEDYEVDFKNRADWSLRPAKTSEPITTGVTD